MDPEEKEKFEKRIQEKKLVENIYFAAAKRLNEQMQNDNYEWLQNKYGIKKETADNLLIGYSLPSKYSLKNYLQKEEDFEIDELKKSGLFVKDYDLFQGRIVFPYWKNRKPVFFIGRKTENTPDNNWEQGKYKKLLTYSEKNSYVSETVQNQYFFGEDTVEYEEALLITEGITDAIMAHQAGFPCISPVTVQFREDDYDKLLDIAEKAEKVYIANDNEESEAGKKGALKTAKFLQKNGVKVKLIELPKPDDQEKIDLADFLRENSASDFKNLMDEAQTPLELAIEKVKNAPADQKTEIANEEVFPLLLKENAIDQDKYLKNLQDAFGGQRDVRISTLRDKLEEREEKEEKKRREEEFDDYWEGPIQPLEIENNFYAEKYFDEDNEVKVDPLCNFILKIEEKLKLPASEKIFKGKIKFEDGEEKEISLQAKDFTSNRDFRQALPAKASWLGKNSHLQRLRINLDIQNFKEIEAVEVAGRHGSQIVLPELILKNEDEEEKNLKLYTERNSLADKIPSEIPKEEELRKAAEKIYKNLPRINDPEITFGIIGWNFALPWCDIIRTEPSWGGFPHLVIWGEAGSGKTQTGKLIWRLNGVSSSHEPFSLPNTRFTRLKNYSATNLVPVFLDEYRPSAWHKRRVSSIHEELRNIYNKNSAERGTASQKINSYPMAAPVILCGEDRPRDTLGLDERMIILRPDKDVVEGNIKKFQGCREHFAELQRANMEKFAIPYWRWALKKYNWKEILENERREISEWANQSTKINSTERITNNLAIIKFGWVMFRKYGDYLGIEPNNLIEDDIESALLAIYNNIIPEGKQLDEFDKLMKLLTNMVENNQLRYRVDFSKLKRNDKKYLAIRLNPILDKAREYADKTNYKQEILSKDVYRQMAKRKVKRNSYITATGKRAYYGSKENGKQLRSIIIDPEKMEKDLDIESAIWTSTFKDRI
nr:toprim domain-containing protein [Halarsenatibacter silvermanii]